MLLNLNSCDEEDSLNLVEEEMIYSSLGREFICGSGVKRDYRMKGSSPS